MDEIKIIISDSQLLTSEGICSWLQKNAMYKIIANTHTKQELFEMLNKQTPFIIVLDAAHFDNFELTDLEKLTETFPPSRILIITNNTTRDFILKIIETGISHFILKNCKESELEEALSSIRKNEKYLCKEVINTLLENKIKTTKNEDTHLTKKEIEIIKYIALGLTNKEIAEKDLLSIHTIQTHRKNILKKLELKNTSELVMYAVKAGLTDTMEYYI